MKNILLILTVVVAAYLPSNKPKFKYLSTGTPLYLSAYTSLDSSEAVLSFLKDTLQKMKINVIGKSQYDEINRENLAYAKAEMTKTAEMIRNNTLDLAGVKARAGNLNSGIPVQSVTLLYTSSTNASSNISSCDSVGFSHKIYPSRSGDPRRTRVMWSIEEIGSRVPDSIGLFILKKM